MKNIKFTIEYDGSRYAGWQVQDNAITVQEVVERSLEHMIGKHYRVTGAGRTDSGVHARGQVAHVRIASKLPCKAFLAGMNSFLPQDIVIKRVQEVDQDFHARFSAFAKIYEYTIYNSRIRSPHMARYSWWVVQELSVNAMRRAARCLVGKHDFKAFQASDKRERSSVRTVQYIHITADGPIIKIKIKADGFLYNMVRSIVGTLVEIGRGKISAGEMKAILASRDRSWAGQTAPPQGLCLEKVFYK